MNIRKLMSVFVIVAFLGVAVLPVSANDTTDALVIIGPAILGVALLITLVAVVGTRSKEKQQAEIPGSTGYAARPGQPAEPAAGAVLEPRHPMPAHEGTPSTPRSSTGFAMLCPQGPAGIAVACW